MLEEVEAIRVTITLGRKLLGVLLNVFVPTTILNLIGFSTNFYKVTDDNGLFLMIKFAPNYSMICYKAEAQDAYFESVIAMMALIVMIAADHQISYKAKSQDAYFESVIAINLTSMLVLVALFVQVSKHF